MLNILAFIAVLFFLTYAALLLFYKAGWNRLNEHRYIKSYVPKTKLSIIVPARNEEKHIESLLRDISNQLYPRDFIDLIVVDDHSEDRTAEKVAQFPNARCLSLSDFTQGKKLNAYKKKAIEMAIQQSAAELIITVDADCRMGPYWLLSIVNYFETYRPHLIASPVLYQSDHTWFQTFQAIDFLTMQGITAALASTHSGTMCNGANLAYTRNAFETVKGFDGIDDIASGDDMLLMYKIEKAFPGKTTYLKCIDSQIHTFPAPSLHAFLQQRIRWASKSTKFEDKRIKGVLAFVFFFNLLFPICLLLSFFHPGSLFIFALLILGKSMVELMLLIPVAKFFNQLSILKYFVLFQFIHIPYIIYAALKGQTGSYEWKNREVY